MACRSSKESPGREKTTAAKKTSRTHEGGKPKLKLSFSEQHEFKTIEEEIAKDEQRLRDLEDQIHRDASDYVKLSQHTAQKEEIEKALELKMNRWVYLNDMVEKIQGNKEKS